MDQSITTRINRKILVTLSDTHAGSKVALMNPETVLYSEDERGNFTPYSPKLTASQEYLWKLYKSNIDDLSAIADGYPIMCLHLGDECNGNKHPDMLVSDRLSDQVIIAEYNARPLLDMPNMQYFRQVVGTGAHNFGFGSSALLLCQTLIARYPHIDIKPLMHGLLSYSGVTVDFSHHRPGTGIRDWLKGNIARLYLRSLMSRALKAGHIPPRLVLRGHFHSPVYELLRECGYTSEIYVLPSFSMFNDHSTQVTQSESEIAHGMLVHEIENGEIVRTHELYQKIDVRTVEVIP